MGRVWKKKTDRIRATEKQIQEAVERVKEGHSLRETARNFNISKSALSRHVRACGEMDVSNYIFTPNTTVNQVFTNHQEEMLAHYLKQASKMHYGLSPLESRKLAYQYAVRLNVKYPDSWTRNERAGKEWFFGFMRRHSSLSIRRPEATSLSRSTSFNKKNVGDFFTNVADVYKRHNFQAHRIWNCDETGLTTVHRPSKVVGQKGMKQVGQVTSGERGQLVTLCCFINAAGNTIPPVFIFPRVNFKPYMLNQAPPDSLGLAHKSGWMTGENFILALKHFFKYTKCTPQDPVVLFLDNHESHISVEVIQEAKDNGVYLITFPPHCSHRLQPLDVAVYGPFKARFNQACDNWMMSHGGMPITIYNIAELAGIAFNGALNKDNIRKGFEKTGIWDFQPNVFSDDDFLMSAVTDRPDQTVQIVNDDTVDEQVNINTSSTSQSVDTRVSKIQNWDNQEFYSFTTVLD